MPNRRSFCTAVTATFACQPWRLAHSATPERRLRMRHLHTGERIDTRFWRQGRYDQSGLDELDHHLRDWRQNEVIRIDPRLYDLIYAVASKLNAAPNFEIICGYRSPKTNELLRRQGRGVATRSLHLVGQAIDLRLNGARLDHVRTVARAFGIGGVGYYPGSNFVHLDTGRPRQWTG